MNLQTVIGLEVHVQLGTNTKLFSRAPVAFAGTPNSRVAPLDLGLPGTLPAPNREAVRLGVRTALALGGTVHERTTFERKNYFYPDLPKGYQISQYREPFCTGGRVPLDDLRTCPLTRVHLEEDAGKSSHGPGGSLLDLNRAGVPLVEIVSDPALHNPEDAHRFLVHLKEILRYAGVSDCDMEKGELRCDANISLRPADATALGTRVEIKNLNSFKMVKRALQYEERRQAAVLAAGGTVVQETRLWNDELGETAPMRSKEEAEDYRYFPDPDLPPLVIPPAWIEEERAALPELPAARRTRWASEYGLTEYDLGVLLADKELADYFEAVARACGDAKEASNWVQGEVLREVGEEGGGWREFPVAAERLAGLIGLLQGGQVSRPAAKKIFARMLEDPAEPAALVATMGLGKITDPAALAPVLDEVLAGNEKAVADYRAGKVKALHALKGQVMRATRGSADPEVVERLLVERLG